MNDFTLAYAHSSGEDTDGLTLPGFVLYAPTPLWKTVPSDAVVFATLQDLQNQPSHCVTSLIANLLALPQNLTVIAALSHQMVVTLSKVARAWSSDTVGNDTFIRTPAC